MIIANFKFINQLKLIHLNSKQKEKIMGRLGCCGSFLRLSLSIVNILFLLIGLTVFIAASVLRWGSDSIIEEITKNEAIASVINISVINNVSISLLVIGGFIILLSLIGLLGVLCTNRCFLYLYEITIIILFLAHGITLIVVTLSSTSIENEFRTALNKTMDTINDPSTTEKDFEEQCAVIKGLSELFQCCGSTSRADFRNQTISYQCCINSTSIGCGEKTIDSINDNAVNLVFIPNGVILVFELLLILMVPFLIARISRSKERKDDEDKLINDTYRIPRYAGRA